jgi:AcrR family transcriptional regulator
MPAPLRQELRDTTRRRIIAADRDVFVEKGYAKATIEEITGAAGVGRATLYLHFDSKFALLTAATEKMWQEASEAPGNLTQVLIAADRAELRKWVEWALGWYVRSRPMARAAEEAELSEDKPLELLRSYLESLEPWVETWPVEARGQARLRLELCRVQMEHYMWGKSHALFSHQDLPVDLFTEIWWNTLISPLAGSIAG